MLVSEVVSAIQQRNKNYLDPTSLLREITQVRDRLMRTINGGQQQSDAIVTMFDLQKDRTVYPLPAPANSIVEVAVKDADFADYSENESDSRSGWYALERKQLDQSERSRPYYYVTGGFIGLSRKPNVDVTQGLKIFHYPVLLPLQISSLTDNSSTGFDPNFDMLLVYGVLKEITTAAEANEFAAKFQEIYDQYVRATNGFESYQVKRRW